MAAPNSPKPEKKRRGLVQSNVRYPAGLLSRASAAAAWEGINFSNYMRSALMRRVRGTEAERAREENPKGK